jgi:hypothetical protein
VSRKLVLSRELIDTPYYLDIAPGSAHAKDDEFTAASLDTKWTNPLSSGTGLTLSTTTAGDGWLVMEPATSGTSSTGKHLFGIRQAAPTGSFSISAKVGGGKYDDDTGHGLFVARTGNSQAYSLGHYSNSFLAARGIGFANYSETADAGAFDSTNQDYAVGWWGITWFKMVYDASGSTLNFYWSGDGCDWVLVWTKTSVLQPDRIGLAMYSNSGTVVANHKMFVDWFRVTEP